MYITSRDQHGKLTEVQKGNQADSSRYSRFIHDTLPPLDCTLDAPLHPERNQSQSKDEKVCWHTA